MGAGDKSIVDCCRRGVLGWQVQVESKVDRCRQSRRWVQEGSIGQAGAGRV